MLRPRSHPAMLRVLQDRFALHLQQPELRLQGPVSVRAWSLVFRGSAAGAAAPEVAIKWCRDPQSGGADRPAARAQYEALCRVDQALRRAPPGFGAPQPLHLDLDEAAYAMRWLSGHSLTEQLTRLPGPAQACQAMARVGAWLGHFHRLGPARAGCADLRSKSEQLQQMQAQPLADPLFAHAVQRLAASEASIGRQPTRLSWLHGDCKTDNFMLSDSAVHGIDIALAFENTVEHDLAQFLNHLDLLLQQGRHRPLRPHGAALQAALLQGYADTGADCQPAVLAWLRLWSATAAWHTQARSAGRLSPAAWLASRACRARVAALAHLPHTQALDALTA